MLCSTFEIFILYPRLYPRFDFDTPCFGVQKTEPGYEPPAYQSVERVALGDHQQLVAIRAPGSRRGGCGRS